MKFIDFFIKKSVIIFKMCFRAQKKKGKKERVLFMGLKTFKGGVHPKDGKDLSKAKPIKEYLPTGDLVFPVSQHIGAPAVPIVAVGDTVKKGQKIA